MSDFYAGKAVLVTGGVGFIGSNLVIELVRRGATVTIVDAMLPAYGASLSSIDSVRDRVRLSTADLRDGAVVRTVIQDQEVIFNLAGQMSHLSSMRDPATDLEINCRAQLSLLESCRAVKCTARLVLASTRQVYGRPRYLPVDEQHPTVPIDVNGIHKLAAEMYYTLYAQVHALDTVILRLTNTYGPRMDLRSRDKGVTNVLLHRALNGQRLQLYGTGQQRRDFNFVDDVVDALLRAGASAELRGRLFNLGHPQPRSLLEFAAVLRALTGCDWECVPFPEAQRAIDIGDYWGNFDAFQAATGWSPRVDLDAGLRETVAFFRAQ